VGGEREAIAWMEREKGLSKGLPVRDYRRRSGFEELGLMGSFASAARGLGLERMADAAERLVGKAEALSLDGLLAVWQPAIEN
jgi:protease IV